MGINIEKLLWLTADYHNFCSDDYARSNINDSDELSMEDLDLIAAATGAPVIERENEMDNNKSIY